MASGTVVESDLAGPALSLTEGEEERLLDSDREDNNPQSVSFLLCKEFILCYLPFFLSITRHFFYPYSTNIVCIHFLNNPVDLRRTKPSELV